MGAGFGVAILGHLAGSRWLVAIGVIMILLATLLFPLALQFFARRAASRPGPRCPLAAPLIRAREDGAVGRSTSSTCPSRCRKKEEAKELERAQKRLAQLRLTLGGQLADGGEQRIGPPVLVLFEGWDASGKGGAIKRLVAPARPAPRARLLVRRADSTTRSATTSSGASGAKLPGWGGMAVFDRSWYGRVLVERVEGFATREQWLRAYDEINNYERSLTDEGMILVKFWLHLSPEEQLQRFEAAREPAEELEADRRGLAQPREARRLRRGGRGHARAHRPAERALEPDRGRLEALGAGGGDRHRDRPDRGGHARVGDRARRRSPGTPPTAWSPTDRRRRRPHRSTGRRQ